MYYVLCSPPGKVLTRKNPEPSQRGKTVRFCQIAQRKTPYVYVISINLTVFCGGTRREDLEDLDADYLGGEEGSKAHDYHEHT